MTDYEYDFPSYNEVADIQVENLLQRACGNKDLVFKLHLHRHVYQLCSDEGILLTTRSLA